MKKFLMILAATGLTVTTTTSVIACGNPGKQTVDTTNVVKNEADLTLNSNHQSATLALTISEALNLKLIQQLDQNYVKNADNWVDTLSVDNNTIVLSATFVFNQSSGKVEVTIFADNPMQSATDVVFSFNNDRTLIIKDLYLNYQPDVNLVKAVNIDGNHEFATLTLTQGEALSLKLIQVGDNDSVSYGRNWIDHFEWVVGVNQTLIKATLELKPWTNQVEITFSTNKAMNHSENLILALDSNQNSKCALIITGLNLDYVRTDPMMLQKYPTSLSSNHQSATFALTFNEALSLKLAKFDAAGVISQGINWPLDNRLTTALENGSEITAKLTWQENGGVEVTLTSSQRMVIASDVVFVVNRNDEPLARLLVGGLNLDWDAELTITKASSDVKLTADEKSAVLTLTASEAQSLKITPASLTTYLSLSVPWVTALPSFNDDGSVGLTLTPQEVMDEPTTVTFEFGDPDYSAKQLVIKDLYLDLKAEVVHQGSELTFDRSGTSVKAKLTLSGLEAQSLGLSKQDLAWYYSTTTPNVTASLDFLDSSLDFTFTFSTTTPITTPINVSFNFAKPGKTSKILTIQGFTLE